MVLDDIENDVSTHSRTKAAAIADITPRIFTVVSTHSRTKAAAERERQDTKVTKVSTHSRTKAAADILQIHQIRRSGFNTQPHEGGCIKFFTTLFN